MELLKISLVLAACALAFGSVNAGSLLGAGQCERGPDFWCASQENAELCSTVQYCQNKVWLLKQHRQASLGAADSIADSALSITALDLRAAHTVKEKNDGNIVTCLVCKAVMSELQHLIKKNSTRDDIRKALEKVCSLVHSSKCKSFVDKYIDKLVELIADKVPFSKICSKLHLCSAPLPPTSTTYSVVDMKERPATGGDNSIQCMICQAVMSELSSLLNKNSTRSEIREALEKVCNLVHSSECKEFVDKYVDIVIDYIENDVPFDQICSLLQLCSMPTPPKPAADTQPEGTGSVECTICKALMSQLASLLKKNSTRDEIREALEKVCNLVHSSECVTFVDQHVDQIVDFLEHNVPFDKICGFLKMCDTGSAMTQEAAARQPVRDSVECLLCKSMMSQLKSLLKQNSTRDEIREALEKVCNLVHSSECVTFVDQHVDQIVDFLENNVPFDKICVYLGMCDSQQDFSTPNKRYTPKLVHPITRANV